MSTLHSFLTLATQVHGHLADVAATAPAAPVATPAPTPVPTPLVAPSASTGSSSSTSTGSSSFTLPTLLLSGFVWAPLVGALVVLFLPSRTEEDDSRIRVTGMFATVVSWIVAFLVTVNMIGALDAGAGGVDDTTVNVFENHTWLSSFPLTSNYHLDVDGVTLPFMMLSAIVFAAVILLSWRRTDSVRDTIIWLLVAETGVNGFLCARDYLLLTSFLGLMVLAVFMLLRRSEMGTVHDAARERMARRFFIFNAAALLLFALGGLLAATQATPGLTQVVGTAAHPTFDTTSTNQQPFPFSISVAGFIMMFSAFLIMSGGFPFHRWQIAATGDSETGSGVIVTALVTRLAAYGMLTMTVVAFGPAVVKYSSVVMAIAVLTALWGAVGTIVEADLRRSVGYLGMAQTGAVLIGVAGVNVVSLTGAVVVIIAGALSTMVLTFVAGAVEERARHRDIRRLGGLAAQMPRLAGFWIVAALSAVGVPFLAGFAGDFTLFTGSFVQHRFATLLVLGLLTVAGGAVVWNGQRVFFGPPKEIFARVKDGSPLDFALLTPPVILMVMYGVLPGRIMTIIAQGVNALVGTRIAGS